MNENVSVTKIIGHFRERKTECLMKYFMRDERISHISMFHKITTSSVMSDDQDECRMEDLLAYIDYCFGIGTEFISLDDLFSMNVNNSYKSKAVITFDDGCESVWTVASKELIDRSIPFTCFITTSLIGKEGYITSEQLKCLSRNYLCTIGMHSDQHVFWRGKSKEELEKDYLRCRQILSDIIGYEPCYYAFPYGSYSAVSQKNLRAIKKLSPRAIFLTDQRKLTRRDLKNPLSGLPRLDIPGYYKGYYKKEYMGLKLT